MNQKIVYPEKQRCAFWAMGWQHVAMGPTPEIINKHKPRRLMLHGANEGHPAWRRMFLARQREIDCLRK